MHLRWFSKDKRGLLLYLGRNADLPPTAQPVSSLREAPFPMKASLPHSILLKDPGKGRRDSGQVQLMFLDNKARLYSCKVQAAVPSQQSNQQVTHTSRPVEHPTSHPQSTKQAACCLPAPIDTQEADFNTLSHASVAPRHFPATGCADVGSHGQDEVRLNVSQIVSPSLFCFQALMSGLGEYGNHSRGG